MGFYASPLNPTSLTCEMTAAEATRGKQQGKLSSFGKNVK